MSNHRAAILLAAGQGSRLRPLTEGIPKCLLPIGGKKIIDTILPPLLDTESREIIVVAGFAADKVEEHIANNYPNCNIRVVKNDQFAIDVNILSTEIGISALSNPKSGYTIIETDLLLSPDAWELIMKGEKGAHSFWVTKDRYHAGLTGGIVHVGGNNIIDKIAYVPQYDRTYEGWHKMIGILSVSSSEVEVDCQHRRASIIESCAQYYMMPWIQNINDLPCFALDLAGHYAKSFNTSAEYNKVCFEYSQLFLQAKL